MNYHKLIDVVKLSMYARMLARLVYICKKKYIFIIIIEHFIVPS